MAWAMAFDPNQIATANIGTALIGVVRGNEVSLAWKLHCQLSESSVELAIFYLGQDPQYVPLPPSDPNGSISQSVVSFDDSMIIEGMLIVVRSGKSVLRLDIDSSGFYLHRLLSRNLSQVSANLRKHGRIKDLDTRFFSASNSIKAAPGNFALNARCVVSFGYSAIEEDRPEMVDWAYSFIINRMSDIASTSDFLVKSSMLTLWSHIAIWKGIGGDLVQISRILKGSFGGLAEYPRAAYNSMSLLLLLGGFLLFTGHSKEAEELFGPSDDLLRIAANGYINADYLMTYREFIRIAECAFLCKLGSQMSSGVSFHPSLAPLTPEMAWDNANRFFRGDTTRVYPMAEIGREKYLRLIESSAGCAA